jgi:hypothetical protein
MLNPLKSFTQYLTEEEEILSDAPLKGYTADQIIDRIGELMNFFSDSIKFGVPADLLGRASTYRDANGAIEKVKDIQHYYESSGEEVRFYCWSIAYRGSWDATNKLKDKINAAGGFGDESNMSIKKIIEYFTNNREDSDNVRSISISLDSKEKREALKKKEASTDGDQESSEL